MTTDRKPGTPRPDPVPSRASGTERPFARAFDGQPANPDNRP